MDAKGKQLLLAKLRKQREKVIDLGDGKKLTVVRPPEAEMADLLVEGPDKTSFWRVSADHVSKYVVGWSGVTEADLIGAAIGASDPIDFDSDVWAEVSSDRVDWYRAAADAILKAVVDHINARETVAKN